MTPVKTQETGSGLFHHIYHSETVERKHLQQAAQLALQVEFTTIPVYLTGMYSIIDPTSTAYQVLRDVVMEEMFHLSQAANTLVGMGGLPQLTGDAVPRYPCYLPHANPATTPFVGLLQASQDVFNNVYAAIEQPAPPHAPAQGDQYDTIAQLYDALEHGMERFVKQHGEAALFEQAREGRQRLDIYIGKFGGKPVEVTNLKSARHGILEITQQGEGSVPPGQVMVSSEPWSTYNHYGNRSDGTYGPIIGTPTEMSHFAKFLGVALSTSAFPQTYPILSNPKRSDFCYPLTQGLAQAFDMAYSIMLDHLQHSFRKPGKGDKDSFFSVVLPLMHTVMPVLARLLMTTPVNEDGDGSVGPNAAPTWIYQAGASIHGLRECIGKLLALPSLSSDQQKDERAMLESVHASLQQF